LFLFRRERASKRAHAMNSDAHSMVMSNEIIMRSHTTPAPPPPSPPPPLTKENNFPGKLRALGVCVFLRRNYSFRCSLLHVPLSCTVESVPGRIFHHFSATAKQILRKGHLRINIHGFINFGLAECLFINQCQRTCRGQIRYPCWVSAVFLMSDVWLKMTVKSVL
jgi:hypothetical protein